MCVSRVGKSFIKLQKLRARYLTLKPSLTDRDVPGYLQRNDALCITLAASRWHGREQMKFYHEEIKLREKATYSAEKDVCFHLKKINPKKRESPSKPVQEKVKFE